jgi:clan AA aspartic protease
VGIARAKIKLDNPKRSNLEEIEVDALVDTGSLFLCLPEEVSLQLELQSTSQKEVTTAEGRRCLCPYVGPVRVRFENRECYVGAVVLGDEVLLGAVPMEDMDLVVIPATRRVSPIPSIPILRPARRRRVE